MTTTDRGHAGGGGWIGTLDRGLYALFSRHADSGRHERNRARYRGAHLTTGFDVYIARVYGLSWLAFVLVAAWTGSVALSVPPDVVSAVVAFVHAGAPVFDRVALPAVPRWQVAVAAGMVAGVTGKVATVWLGGTYLRWSASVRRSAIERTLPGAVRYLRALVAGTDDRRTMLRKVADQDAYGETGTAFRRILNTAELTGSLDSALRTVARDTPSRDQLAPFLLKFREHSNQGQDALEGYLKIESRMLSHQQARARQRAGDFLELLAEMFIVLLVLPALLVVVVTVLSVLAPGLSRPIATPLGLVTPREVLVYGSAAFVLVVGLGAALLVEDLRPPGQSQGNPRRPSGLALLASAAENPASAAVVVLPVAAVVAVGLWLLGYDLANVVLLGYVAYGLPVGLVGVHRARVDDAKDREIRDFIHAVSGHVSLGRPFGDSVEIVAREVDLGALQADVDDLAFTLGLATDADGRGVRSAALERFAERVGTPLAEQTIGLLTGALEVGSDTEKVFETLQEEVGRLHHEKKKLRSAMLVYVAVGWTTALLVVGIMVALNSYVLDGFTQLSSVSGSTGLAIDPDAVQPARDRQRFYVVTQATMVACGWFAGTASRGRYEALLHSAALVAACYFVFAGTGMI